MNPPPEVIVVNSVHFRKTLDNDGELRLTGLPGKKGEEAEVIVIFQRAAPEGMTLGDLLRSDIVGLWKDRTEIGDSVEFARELRKRVQRRGN